MKKDEFQITFAQESDGTDKEFDHLKNKIDQILIHLHNIDKNISIMKAHGRQITRLKKKVGVR